jgi:hypothetical protein
LYCQVACEVLRDANDDATVSLIYANVTGARFSLFVGGCTRAALRGWQC